MNRLLFHPRTTLLLIAGACGSAVVVISQVVSTLGTLNAVLSIAKYVAPVTATLSSTVTIATAIGALCAIGAGIGRSPVSAIDNNTPPAPPAIPILAPSVLVPIDRAEPLKKAS